VNLFQILLDDKFLYDRVEKLQLKYNPRAIVSLIKNKETPAPLSIEKYNLEMYDWVMINHNNIDNCNEVGQVFYIGNKIMYMYIFDLGVMPLVLNNILLNPISSVCKNSYLLSIKQLHKEIKDYKIKKDMINTTNLLLKKKLNKDIYWI
jgi:hypothetical protein